MHALDRPIWSALTTSLAGFAEARGDAVRFQPEVTSLAAVAASTPSAWASLADLLAPGEAIGLFLDEEPELAGSGLVRAGGAEILQMVHEASGARVAPVAFLELGAADVPEMVDLATRTKPGPFARRTAELGTFLGVREGGRLLAMAGQRLRFPGHIEVSAVCTDPDALGRGLAAALMSELVRRIRAAAQVPLLHVRADNTRAIALYQRLGFAERRRFAYVLVER
jgi:ribosomal protein S18 acetylase RimI-like enzyme